MTLGKTIKDIAVLAAKTSAVSTSIKEISRTIEKRVERQVKIAKKEITDSIMFLSFVILAVVFISGGIIGILANFMPIEFVLLIFGFIFAIIALIFKLF